MRIAERSTWQLLELPCDGWSAQELRGVSVAATTIPARWNGQYSTEGKEDAFEKKATARCKAVDHGTHTISEMVQMTAVEDKAEC